MSQMGEEDSVFVRLLIQGTSTKNFYFIPSPQSAVRVLYLDRVLYPVRIFQSAFYTQSAVRSPLSMFYTDRTRLHLGAYSFQSISGGHFPGPPRKLVAFGYLRRRSLRDLSPKRYTQSTQSLVMFSNRMPHPANHISLCDLLSFHLPKTPVVESTNLVFRVDVPFHGLRVPRSPLRLAYTMPL